MLLNALRDWYCPNCGLQDRTQGVVPNRYHQCPKLHGILAPMLPAGLRAKVTAHERPDYEGDALVQRDAEGRPIYMVETIRDEGSDAIVFPDTARVGVNT